MSSSGNHNQIHLTPDLWPAVRSFEGWLAKTGYASYDPYDLWGTPLGLKAREIYYRRGKLGVPLIAPFLLLEVLCPSLRSLFVKKQRFATADAQLALAFINLYELTQDRAYLEKALHLADDLLKISAPGYSGLGWGYPFDWQNCTDLWRKNTPLITATPYCFEVFTRLHDVTHDQRYLDSAVSIARFVANDLKDTPTGPGAAAGSYSPLDTKQVINASAYRAFVLFEADGRFPNASYRAKAQGNLNFILQNQRPDGSWLYSANNPAESFIDHFHTCFVLKNLYKLNRRLNHDAVRDAIRKGWDYYCQNLFEADGTPKSFAIQPRLQISRFEMYNIAEAITLGSLLRHEIPEAWELAGRLAGQAKERYQLRAGYFITRTYLGGWRHTMPFLRWPQAQMFYALTNFLKTGNQSNEKAAVKASARESARTDPTAKSDSHFTKAGTV